jgi:hypothetical protein
MAVTPATGSIAAVADMATAIIGMVQTYEASHNTPGMLQAAIAAQWQAQKDSATKAVATEDTATVQKDLSA